VLLLRTSLPNGGGVRLGLRDASRKLVIATEDGTTEFFDLEVDPGERSPTPLTREVEEWRWKLDPFIQSQADSLVGHSADEVRQLRALGYVDIPAPENADPPESTETRGVDSHEASADGS
jgi:hypothetical protein